MKVLTHKYIIVCITIIVITQIHEIVLYFRHLNHIMNKIITLFLLLLLAVSFQSCKKESSVKESEPDKTYLVTKITKHYDTGDDQQTFEYDSQGRITKNIYSNITYIYSYDSESRLAKNEIYTYRGLLVTYNYTYANNKMTETRVSPENGIDPQVFTYEINNGNIVKAILLDGSAITYNFDGKGNVTQYQYVFKNGDSIDEGSLTYDDKKSPFAMVKGYNKHYLMSNYDPEYSIANNILSNHYYKFTFKYNDAGFPVSAIRSGGGNPDLKIDYEYIVK